MCAVHQTSRYYIQNTWSFPNRWGVLVTGVSKGSCKKIRMMGLACGGYIFSLGIHGMDIVY